MFSGQLPSLSLDAAPGGRLNWHGWGAELLDAVVGRVCYIDVAAGVHRHAERQAELPVPAADTTERSSRNLKTFMANLLRAGSPV